MSEPSDGGDFWVNVRRGAGALALLALLIFVALNFGRVNVDFVIVDVNLPLAFALIFTAVLGFLVGMAVHHRR